MGGGAETQIMFTAQSKTILDTGPGCIKEHQRPMVPIALYHHKGCSRGNPVTVRGWRLHS